MSIYVTASAIACVFSISCAPARAQPKARPAPAPAPIEPRRIDEPKAPIQSESAACEAATVLPGLAQENADWTADIAHNVAFGLQVVSCSRMAADTGPLDLFDTMTFVACQPPRLCSAGPDRQRGTSDDFCQELVQGKSTAPRTMRRGWTRRFLIITKDMRPGCASPDATIASFYAGLMRRDGSHTEALPPRDEWDDVLTRKMDKHDRFHFHGARLHGLSCTSDTACEYEVSLTVSFKADSPGSSGVDQGRIEKRGERWLIVRPPT